MKGAKSLGGVVGQLIYSLRTLRGYRGALAEKLDNLMGVPGVDGGLKIGLECLGSFQACLNLFAVFGSGGLIFCELRLDLGGDRPGIAVML